LLTPDECLRMPGPKKNAQGDIEEAGDMVCTSRAIPRSTASNRCTSKTQCFGARRDPAPKVSDRLRAVAQAETEGEGITI
jgi:type IV secretion system protein VirD4